jgi:hypothetical protein
VAVAPPEFIKTRGLPLDRVDVAVMLPGNGLEEEDIAVVTANAAHVMNPSGKEISLPRAIASKMGVG